VTLLFFAVELSSNSACYSPSSFRILLASSDSFIAAAFRDLTIWSQISGLPSSLSSPSLEASDTEEIYRACCLLSTSRACCLPSTGLRGFPSLNKSSIIMRSGSSTLISTAPYLDAVGSLRTFIGIGALPILALRLISLSLVAYACPLMPMN